MSRAKTRRPTTRGGRARARQPSAIPIEDDQLVEVEEVAPPLRARVAIHEASAGSVGLARGIARMLGHDVVAAGAGQDGVAEVIAVLRDDEPPAVLVVGLPGGDAALDVARALGPRRPVVVAACDGPATAAARQAAAAGADLFAVRPHDADKLAPVLAAAARIADERRSLSLARGTQELLRGRLEQYGRADTATGFQQFEFFQRVLELELKRARRYGYALSVCLLGQVGDGRAPPVDAARTLRKRAAQAIGQAVRDIDLPTEIGDDRFLVLLPYTDVDGAALVGRRMVAAVAEHEPVVVDGRRWRARVVAGIAGLRAGQPVSFAKLMKDAGAALRDARERGVDLVVAP